MHECNSVIDDTTGVSQEHRHLMKILAKLFWQTALGRLAQCVGIRMPKITNTIKFIRRQGIPTRKKFTYAPLAASLGRHKKEVNRVHVTVGGDRLVYVGIMATQVASLTTGLFQR